MTRLPTVGGDSSNWGTILNAYLGVGHNASGSTSGAMPVFNVKDDTYGAKGDLTTDDAAAIQACINASTPGSIVYFPGNHLVGATIQLLANRTYVAPTWYTQSTPTFKQKNGANLPAVVASYDWYNNSATAGYPLSLKNIMVDANSANNTTSHGIVLMNFDSIISECSVQNTPGAGIVISSVSLNGTSVSNSIVENRVEKCKILNTNSYGIYGHDTNGLNTDGYIEDCIISNPGDTAIYLERAAGWFVRQNHVYACQTSGIVAKTCWSTQICQNEIDGFAQSATPNYYAGISVGLIGARPSTIEGNIISVGTEANESTHYQYLAVDGEGILDTKAVVVGNSIQGGWIQTTSSTSLVSGAKTPCAPLSMIGIVPGITVTINYAETVTVASVTSTTFTPTTNWASNHSGTYPVISAKSSGLSIGLLYTSNGTQQGSTLPCTIISAANRVDAVGTYDYVDTYTTVGPVVLDGGLVLPESASWDVLASSGVIPMKGIGTSVVNPSGNVTDIRLQAGSQSGQLVSVLNVSGHTVTFNATQYTALIGDAASTPVLAAYTARLFVWDATQALWYRMA